jgi:hypothetical protein
VEKKITRINMKKHLGLYLAGFIFILQLVLLPRVGMSWDEPSSFFVGRANLKFWMTGNRAYLNDLQNKKLFTDSPFPYIFGEDIYPPFQFLVSSATSYVLAEKMHLMNIVTAHHLGELCIATLGIAAMYGLAVEVGLTSAVAGMVTVIYVFYPTIVDLMRNDAKDIPLMSLLVVSAYFCVRTLVAWQKKRGPVAVWGNGIIFSVFFGLAEATKPTTAIFVPIVIVWFIVASVRNKQFAKSLRPIGPLLVLTLALGALALLVFLLGWPWLWDDPVGKLLSAWSFFKTVGYNMPTLYFGTIYHAGINLPREYPFIILLIQSPIELSILTIIGIVWSVYSFVRHRSVYPILFVIWLLVSIGRFLVPGLIIYARVRHFIDGMPAYFILAGFGAQAIYFWVKNHLKKLPLAPYIILILTLGVVIVHELYICVTYFPYESNYYNAIVGGEKHVADASLFDVGPSSGVKEAMEAIIKDSKGKSVLVYPCLLGHVAMSYTTPTVKLTSTTEAADYAFVPNAVSWFNGAMIFDRLNHERIYTIRRAGADLFYVYKYKSPAGWRCGYETESSYEY